MERPEFNSLRKAAKAASGLIVDEAQNTIRISLYDGGDLQKVVVVMKCDAFKPSKDKVEKIIQLSIAIEERKKSENNKTKSKNEQNNKNKGRNRRKTG